MDAFEVLSLIRGKGSRNYTFHQSHYHNGKVDSETHCSKDLTASFSWYPDGTPKNHGSYLNGQRFGKWTHYHKNGLISFECIFSNGQFNGPLREYYPSGAPRSEGFYQMGKMIQITEWHPKGEVITEYFLPNDKRGAFQRRVNNNLISEGVILDKTYLTC